MKKAAVYAAAFSYFQEITSPGSSICTCVLLIILFLNNYFFNFIAWLYLVNYIKAFNHTAEAGMHTVKVRCIIAAMADKKLRQ